MKGYPAQSLEVKILGIVGTPIKGGNCQFGVEHALKVAEKQGNVQTELVHLQNYNIKPCLGCDGCMRRCTKLERELGLLRPLPVKEYNCGIRDDDMPILHKKMLECDGVIVGAPVYILHVPGQLKIFIDRCRTFAHDYRLQYKVGAGLTTAHFRNLGQENTLDEINHFLMAVRMSIVSLGAMAVSTKEGLGIPIKDKRHGIQDDSIGMPMIEELAVRVVQMTRVVKAGIAVLDPKPREVTESS